MKFVVMIFFRHIELSSGLIGKDVKPREKFHPQQLLAGTFTTRKYHIGLWFEPPWGQATSWASTREVIPPSALFVAPFTGPQ